MKNQPKTGNETLDAEALILNTLNRNCDIVGMACFTPIVNTRGCIFTHPEGIVLRSTYHVFELYVNYLGDEVLEAWAEYMETMQANAQDGRVEKVEVLDVLGTRFTSDGTLAFAAVNKDPFQEKALVCIPALTACTAGSRSQCGVKARNPIMISGIQKWN